MTMPEDARNITKSQQVGEGLSDRCSENLHMWSSLFKMYILFLFQLLKHTPHLFITPQLVVV